VPPYRQVAAILRARIESGDLAPKTRLPSIATLVQRYGIARTTAAKALQLLVAEGLAEVVPGWGTYVTERA
jgi:DNA-binding GntR family transcriptional regulator